MPSRHLLAIIVFLLPLVGCSFTRPPDAYLADQAAQATAQRVACENRVAAEVAREADLVSKMDPRAQEMWAVQNGTAKAISAATGNKLYDCGTGTNYFDLLAKELQYRNESYQTTIRVLPAYLAAISPWVAGLGGDETSRDESPDITISGNGNKVQFKTTQTDNPAYDLAVSGESSMSGISFPGVGAYDVQANRAETNGDRTYGLGF